MGTRNLALLARFLVLDDTGAIANPAVGALNRAKLSAAKFADTRLCLVSLALAVLLVILLASVLLCPGVNTEKLREFHE